ANAATRADPATIGQAAHSSPLFDRRYRRQRRGDDLLAAFHLDQEALAIEVAVGIEMHIEQYAGVVLGADSGSMQYLGEFLRIEFADLLGDRLDHVHTAIALHAVVVALVFVFRLEFLVES